MTRQRELLLKLAFRQWGVGSLLRSLRVTDTLGLFGLEHQRGPPQIRLLVWCVRAQHVSSVR